MKKLPDGWRWVKLGEHVRKLGSGFTPCGGHATYQSSGVPLIRSQNVHMNRFVNDGLAFISDEQDEEMAASRVQAGDVLLNITGASIGRVCVAPSEVCPANVNQHVCVIRGDSALDPDFLAFYLATPDFQKFVLDSQAGATRQALTKAMIEDFQIPFTELSEQRRIAGVLREQMAAVASARRIAEAQLEAGQTLPAAYLRATFSSPEAQQWPRKRLGEVLNPRNEVVHPRDKPTGAATFVGMEHIESGTGKLMDSLSVKMSELTGRKPRFYKGDIVYAYLRPYLNKVWMADFDGLCSVDQYVFAVDSAKADRELIAWFLRSPVYLERAPINTSPGYLPRIRTEEVLGVELNLPPLTDQHRIAAELSERLAGVERLRRGLAEQLEAIGKLPAALLREAFSGRI